MSQRTLLGRGPSGKLFWKLSTDTREQVAAKTRVLQKRWARYRYEVEHTICRLSDAECLPNRYSYAQDLLREHAGKLGLRSMSYFKKVRAWGPPDVLEKIIDYAHNHPYVRLKSADLQHGRTQSELRLTLS